MPQPMAPQPTAVDGVPDTTQAVTTERMLIAGFGGQGILFLGKILAQAAILGDRQVTWMPSYGPEMRGGTANCSVIISNRPIGDPVVHRPDILVAMNEPSLVKFLPGVVPGGVVLVNGSLAAVKQPRSDVRLVRVAATDIARTVGNPDVANMVMAGVLTQHLRSLTRELIARALQAYTPERHQQKLAVSLAALDLGAALLSGGSEALFED